MTGGTPAADAVIVGGGFFGAALARHLATQGRRVQLVERSGLLLGRASYANQARVHLGYHYPRSVLTASRSLHNAARFQREFAECVIDDFTHCYAIGRTFTKVSARQFAQFCARIGAPLSPAPASIRTLFTAALIEDVFVVPEPAFDAVRLRTRLAADLADAGVDVHLDTEAIRVAALPGGGLRTTLRHGGATREVDAVRVFNCTYSRLNALLAASGLPLIALKHEAAEMALLHPPPALARGAVTVMCGPFFSCMPFPALGLHTLSHVRYTPHDAWFDDPQRPWHDAEAVTPRPRSSHAVAMLRDAARYLPAMADSRLAGALWETKTVLPRSENDDGRPILVRTDHGLPGLTCIAGAKVDNIYDLFDSPEVVTAAAGRAG